MPDHIEGAVRPNRYSLPFAVDDLGHVLVDRTTNSLIVDGVRITMEALVHCVNPDPTLWFRAERDGDELRITTRRTHDS